MAAMFLAQASPTHKFISMALIGFWLGCTAPRLAGARLPQQTTGTSTGWRDVSLPFRPVHIARRGTSLWVCGADEMVEKSEDGGRTWTLKHSNPGGDALLTLSFTGEHTIFASGTNGLMLRSDDGGETWKSWAAGLDTVVSISFGDATHGIRRTLSAIEITSDGGQSWHAVLDPNLRTFRYTLGIGAIDATHYLALLEAGPGKSMFLATEDAGATWAPAEISRYWWIHGMFIKDGEYWAFGEALMDDQNPQSYVGSMVLRSPDGLTWSRDTEAPKGSECNMDGCILYDGAVGTLSGRAPRYIAFPVETGALSDERAIAGGDICMILRGLRCATASPSNERPPTPNHPTQSFGEGIDYPVRGCLWCHFYPFPIEKALLKPTTEVATISGPSGSQHFPVSLLHFSAKVDVSYRIHADGTISDVKVAGARSKEIVEGVRDDVGSWLFQPQRKGSGPAKLEKLKILVNCSASQNSDAQCLPQLPYDR